MRVICPHGLAWEELCEACPEDACLTDRCEHDVPWDAGCSACAAEDEARNPPQVDKVVRLACAIHSDACDHAACSSTTDETTWGRAIAAWEAFSRAWWRDHDGRADLGGEG